MSTSHTHINQSAFFDHHPDPVVLSDRAGNCLDINVAFTNFFSMSVSDIIGINISNLLDWTDPQEIRATIASRVPTLTTQLKREQGEVLTLKLTLIPVFQEQSLAQIYIILSDITKLAFHETELEETKSLMKLIETSTSDFIAVLDEQGIIQYASQSHENIFGIPHTEIIGKPALNLVHPDDAHFIAQRLAELFQGIIYMPPVEFRYRHRDGRWLYTEVRGTPIAEPDQIGRILIFARDISNRKEQEAAIKHMAYHDFLTGLPNRQLLRKHLDEILMNSTEQSALVVMLIDLDGFKQINDVLGHTAGDYLLKTLADRLALSLPANGFLARMGGDEFIIVLSPMNHVKEAYQLAERILNTIREPVCIKDTEFYVTASIGISQFPCDGNSAEELIRTADVALYKVKNQGKNGFSQEP